MGGKQGGRVTLRLEGHGQRRANHASFPIYTPRRVRWAKTKYAARGAHAGRALVARSSGARWPHERHRLAQ
ncbi:MAG: hypothetical protein CTY36_05040 [Methylocystis sp.]|nr:MAG: hypothetical protein CTY36_05040 [Methylocystis sp.]